MEYATYQTTPSKNGKGTFYFVDCCNYWIYSVKGQMAYHGCLCPKCFNLNHKMTTLYLRGTNEANKVMKDRGII